MDQNDKNQKKSDGNTSEINNENLPNINSMDNTSKHTQNETENVNERKNEIAFNDQNKDLRDNSSTNQQKTIDSQIRTSKESINNEKYTQLDEISQQTVQNVGTRFNGIIMTASELKYNNHIYLKNSIPSVNIKNNYGLSETNLNANPILRCAPQWRQLMAATGPYLMIFTAGLSCGFSATLLPQLREEKSVILVNERSPSWIASLAALPMAPACFIGGWLMEKLGRRNALRILSIPFFVGWILKASAPSLPFMLLGRFLNGLSIGLLAPPMSVYISETCLPSLRGMLLAFLSFFIALGIFVVHLIGTWISWRWTATICAIVPFCSAGFLMFVPESPVWLLTKGKTEDGIKSFHWLRGDDDEVKSELNAMLDKFKSVKMSSSTEPWKEKLKKFYSSEFIKPLMIMIMIYITCQFSGVHSITFYSIDILEMAVGKGIDRYLAMLTIDILRVLTTLMTCLTSRKYPRRTLCLISGSLTTLSLVGLSIFLYYYKDNIPAHLAVVPLCFLSAFIIAVNIGLMPLPWIIVGEIFPVRIRSIGAGLATTIGYLSTFIVVNTAPMMMWNLGQVTTFLFYGSMSLVGTCILYFIMPETKGKSLLEIEAMFKKVK